MGIKPLRSLSQGQIFSSNNALSANIQERHQAIRLTDLEQKTYNDQSQTVYQNQQPVTEEFLLKEIVRYNSGEQLDCLNEYIFFLKNSSANMDITNLHVPYQIRTKSKGMCEQTQQVQIYYPYYEYKMRPQLQARQNRGETFHESEIWYLLMSVLNGIRQFQRNKCVSLEFCFDNIRFNSIGCVKIDNMMSSPAKMEGSRLQRAYWSHKNIINYFVQETYRLALVLLELCSFLPLQYLLKQAKKREKAIINGTILYNVQGNASNAAERQIQRGLQIVKQRYSDLLYNLLNVMLCHPRDRPLPSQIYQVLVPYKNQIMQFKPFSFNSRMMATIKASLNASNISRQSLSEPYTDAKRKMQVQNSLQISNQYRNQNMFNSMGSLNRPNHLNQSKFMEDNYDKQQPYNSSNHFQFLNRSKQHEKNAFNRAKIQPPNVLQRPSHMDIMNGYQTPNYSGNVNRGVDNRRNLSVNPFYEEDAEYSRSRSNMNKLNRTPQNMYPVFEQKNKYNHQNSYSYNRYPTHNQGITPKTTHIGNTSLNINTYESGMMRGENNSYQQNSKNIRNNQVAQFTGTYKPIHYQTTYLSH